MLFLYLHCIAGGREGSIGLQNLTQMHGVSPQTESEYIAYVSYVGCFSLKRCLKARIQCLTRKEQDEMEGSVVGFPTVIRFFEGKNGPVWRPTDLAEQKYVFDGHHKLRCYACLA